MPFTPDSFGSSAGPPCDCLPPLMEFNLPPPPDPSMFMALDRDFSFSCDQSDNFTPNIHISPDLQQPPYAYHLTEYLTFGISAALAFVLCITVAVLALFYCYRKGRCKKILGKTSNLQMSESSSGSYPVEPSQWSYNSMKLNRNSLKDTDRSLERPRSNIGVVMYGGIELPSATLEGRIPYSARSFRKSLPPTPTANGRHNCTLPIPLSSYRGEQQQQHHSQAEIHYLCSNVPVYEEIPNYIRSDQVRQIHHNNKQMAPTESNRLKNLWATGKEGLIIRASMDSYEIPCSPYHLSTQSESPVSPETTFLAAAISAGRTLTLGDIQSSVTNSLNSPVSHYSSGSNSLQSPKKLSEMNNSQSDDSFVRAVDNISYLDCTNGGRESGYGTEGCNLGLWDSPRSNKKLFLSPQLSGTKKLSETPGCPPSSQRQSRPCRTPTANGHSLAQQFARDIPVELFVPNGRHPKSVVHFVDSEDLDSSAYV